MSLLIGGVTYKTVRIGLKGKRLHLVNERFVGRTWCGQPITATARWIVHSTEFDLLCDNCDVYAKAGREGRTF